MLLAEDRLDVLIDRLAAMAPVDRRDVLAKLPRVERTRVAALLAASADGPAAASFAPDLAARIADGAETLTPLARAALARAVARDHPAAPPARTANAPTSLLGVVHRWLSSGR